METQDKTFPITGKEGAEIDVKVAADWTRNFRHRNSGGAISQFFGSEILNRILSNPDCLGIRIYYANSKPLGGWQRFCVSIGNFFIKSLGGAEGEKHLILAGVTKHGLDLIPGSGTDTANVESAQLKTFKSNDTTSGSTTLLAEQSVPCPGAPNCPQNVLTSD